MKYSIDGPIAFILMFLWKKFVTGNKIAAFIMDSYLVERLSLFVPNVSGNLDACLLGSDPLCVLLVRSILVDPRETATRSAEEGQRTMTARVQSRSLRLEMV